MDDARMLEKQHRIWGRIVSRWALDVLVCMACGIPVMIPGALPIGQQAGLAREDHWRFEAMPENDAGLRNWAQQRNDLKGFTVERTAPVQLVVRYSRELRKGPAKPEWDALGYRGAYLVSSKTTPPGPSDYSALFFPFLFCAMAVSALVAVHRMRLAGRREVPLIDLSARPEPGWWKLVVMAAAFIFVVDVAQTFILRPFHIDPNVPDPIFLAAARLNGWSLPFAILAVVVATPVLEEVIFRGLLLGRFGAYGFWRSGILISAAVFAAAHGEPKNAMELFAGGYVLGLLYSRTRSLWPSIALHALNNAAAFALVMWPLSR